MAKTIFIGACLFVNGMVCEHDISRQAWGWMAFEVFISIAGILALCAMLSLKEPEKSAQPPEFSPFWWSRR